MNDAWEGLPGHELASGGLADLAAGRESEASPVVTMAPQGSPANLAV